MNKLAIVEIIGAGLPTMWYADHVGEIYAVVNVGSPVSAPDYWDVLGDIRNCRSIAKSDCRVLEQRQPIASWNRRAAPEPAGVQQAQGVRRATSWAILRIDDVTGDAYWRLGGDGWKDRSDMDMGECISFDPKTFKEDDRVEIHEALAAPAAPTEEVPC